MSTASESDEENTNFSKELFEHHLHLDSLELITEYLRTFRHNVFYCEFCSEDWSTLEEYLNHLPCSQFEGTERDVKLLAARKLEAKWKNEYNKLRDMAEGVLGGTLPLKAVPYCTCDTFKDLQDCSCMDEKRDKAFKNLLLPPLQQFLVTYGEYNNAKYQVELYDINQEHDQAISNMVTGLRGSRRRIKLREIQRNTRNKMADFKKKLDLRYDVVARAMLCISIADFTVLRKQGRRRIEPQTLNSEQIDEITRKCVHNVNSARMLSRFWGDITGVKLVDHAISELREGRNARNLAMIKKGGELFELGFDSIQRAAVFFTVLCKFTFYDQEFNDARLTKESNLKVRRALSVDLIDYEENFTGLVRRKYFGELSLQSATDYLERLETEMPIPGQPRVTKTLYEAMDSCKRWNEEVIALLEAVRNDAEKKDFDLLGTHVFHNIVHVMVYHKQPLYPIVEARRMVLPRRGLNFFDD